MDIKFKLDPFQEEAISYIAKDENVLITAKTGSGKTFIGEYQIWHSLNKGKRVFYTTPIKSLSNQKFHDLKKEYGDRVGIMTGDIKFAPQSDIIIMTTEILKNLLYKSSSAVEQLSMDNVDAVIFDEVHYINDPSRGNVWEECLVLLPRDVNLVLLSATLDNPTPFCDWLSEIKQKPCHLISTTYRVVPLIHMTEDGSVIMDAKDKFNLEAYQKWFRKYFRDQDELRLHKEKVKNREEGQVIEKEIRIGSFLDRMNKFILKTNKPTLFFVFSRKLCEEYATKVSTDLLTSSETADVKHIIKYHLRNHQELQQIEGYHKLNNLLEKGIAFHHSGMIPILKEIVEILFDKGFIKILFATETFAVGINMPTKTVVFTSFRKYDDDCENARVLRTSEYIQMAGRAGRRGKDEKGDVYYLPIREPEDPFVVSAMMTGRSATVESQMKFDYSYILSSIQNNTLNITDTYWNKQNNKRIENTIKDIESLVSKKPKIDTQYMKDCDARYTLEQLFNKSANTEKKKHQIELNKWTNSHMGPKWMDAWKKFVELRNIEKQIEILEENVKILNESHDRKIHENIQFLIRHGFVDETNNLTPKGKLSVEIHEGNPIMIAELYSAGYLKSCNTGIIVSTLSCFLEEVRTDEIIPKTSMFEVVESISNKFKNDSTEDPVYWKVTPYWIAVVQEWIDGNDFVCEVYGIEHGNFVRAMLKLANIIREWVTIATISQDIEMLQQLVGIEQKIVRSFVVPDSLYLRI